MLHQLDTILNFKASFVYTFKQEEKGFHFLHVYSLWQELSHSNKMFLL